MNSNIVKIKNALSIVGLASIAVIWGFSFVVMKDAVSSIPVLYVLAIRFTLAAVPLGLVFMGKLRKATGRDYLRGVILGVVMAGCYLAQSYGCLYTTASKNALLTAVYTVFVPFVYWLLFKKKPKPYSILFVLLAFGGIACICLDGFGAFNIGDLLTLVGGVLFAFQIALLAEYTRETDPIFISIIQFAVAAVLFWCLSPIEGGFPLVEFTNLSLVWRMLFLGLVCTLACFVLQSVCQKHVSAVTGGLLMSMEAFFGALAGVIFMHDPVYARLFIGCALLALAIFGEEAAEPLLKRKRASREKVQEPPSE